MLITVLVKPKMFRMFTDILSVVFRPEPAEGYACITIDPPIQKQNSSMVPSTCKGGVFPKPGRLPAMQSWYSRQHSRYNRRNFSTGSETK